MTSTNAASSPLPRDSDPTLVWSTNVPAVWNTQSPVLFQGKLLYTSYGKNALHCLDTQTSRELWNSGIHSPSAGNPAVGNGVIAVGTLAGFLEGFSATDGHRLWGYTSGGTIRVTPLFAQGMFLFGQEQGFFDAVDSRSGTRVWRKLLLPANGLSLRMSRAIVYDETVLVSAWREDDQTSVLYALDIKTGQIQWQYQPDNGQTLISADPGVGPGAVYVACGDGSLKSLDIATGTVQWEAVMEGPLTAAPFYANGALYTASDGGNLYALDASTGAQLWLFSPGERIVTNVAVSDGTAYFATDAAKLYAVDVAAGVNAVSFQYTSQGTITPGPTTENGVTYFLCIGDGAYTLGAVNLSGITHEFFVQTLPLADDYDTSGSQPVPKTPAFRAQLRLVDVRKNPRAFQPVKLTASGPATLTVKGQNYAVDVDKAAWLVTDASGELGISLRTTELLVPNLSLWGNFMQPQESIVIYLSQGVTTKLSQVQAEDLAADKAKDFQGNPLLKGKYQNVSSQETIARTIRNSLGGGSSRGAASRPRADATRYLAFPDSMPDTAYVASGPAPGRPLSPGDIPNWTLVVGDTGLSFTPLSDTAPRAPRNPASPGDSRLLGSFGDFISDVIHGAGEVLSLTWQWAEGFVETSIEVFIDEMKKVYHLTVQTLEDAFTVVVGFLKTVVQDLEKVIEWLCWLFEWRDIIETQRKLASYILDNVSTFQTWLGNQISAGLGDVDTFFQRMEGQIANAFKSVLGQIGSTTLQSQTQGGTNPLTLVPDGAYAPLQWILERFNDVTSLWALPSLGGSVGTAFPRFLEQATTALTSSFANLPGELSGFVSNFQLLFTHPEEFVTKSFQDILGLMADFVVDLVRFAAAVVKDFLRFLEAVLDSVVGWLKQSIDLSFFSALYRLITGDDLSLLNVCTLLVAVPATIIHKARGSAVAALGDAGSELMHIGYTLSYYVYTVLDMLMDQQETPSNVTVGIYATLSLLVQGLGFPVPVSNDQVQDYVIWALQIAPFVLTVAGIFVSGTAWQQVSLVANVGYGLMMMGIYVLYSLDWPETYAGSPLYENLLSCLPYLGKPLTLLGENGRLACMTVDAIGDWGATFLSFKYW
ncbi:outer membrane protein assembly factor BamB family protein [Hyalangium gracile]|uniref:outer membrane protein assembly factor BamB family protein n=1 Tax=Hyalangium gracile TaxID=394092 RepID=UPI001CCEC426|nr:PQQ-binding-like beta-propeller repeat protein [Hyalangium gracile]